MMHALSACFAFNKISQWLSSVGIGCLGPEIKKTNLKSQFCHPPAVDLEFKYFQLHGSCKLQVVITGCHEESLRSRRLQ